ncbi:MAG: hypothetical protein KC589_02390 [Nanoarchaeota archaeon]|nr:hypothetical protein [Nanoarchaeota archaeon]
MRKTSEKISYDRITSSLVKTNKKEQWIPTLKWIELFGLRFGAYNSYQKLLDWFDFNFYTWFHEVHGMDLVKYVEIQNRYELRGKSKDEFYKSLISLI